MNAIADSFKIVKTCCLVALFLFSDWSESAAQLQIHQQGDFQQDIEIQLRSLPQPLSDNSILKADLISLFRCYEGFCRQLEYTSRNEIYIIMENGSRILYDDRLAKTFNQKLNSPDLEDMLSLLYRPGPSIKLLHEEDDPGRFRVSEFFKSIYGITREEVGKNLVIVRFCGSKVKFNFNNGAAKALKNVGDELATLLGRKPELTKFCTPPWRNIRLEANSGNEKAQPPFIRHSHRS